jgi:lysophospholipase L1-like esterase
MLLGMEIVAHLFFPRDVGGMWNDPTVFIRGRPFVIADSERGFALSPGFDQGRYRINHDGFRGPELPSDMAERTVILALGDSGTFGWGVDEPNSYPAQLQRLCEENCASQILVVNGGVPSYTSSQTLAYLRELIPRLQPRLVIISVFWNDVLCSVLPNWVPEYLMIQQPAPWRQWLIRHSGLFRAMTIRRANAGLHNAVINRQAIDYYISNLRAMQQECHLASAKCLLLAPSFNEAYMPPDYFKIRDGDLVTTKSMREVISTFQSALLEFREREPPATSLSEISGQRVLYRSDASLPHWVSVDRSRHY